MEKLKNMNRKCPYCLHEFTEAQALKEPIDNRIFYRCPNDATEGQEKKKVCGKALPLNFFDGESLVITIAGGIAVGKTYYYEALLKELETNTALQRLGISAMPIGDSDAMEGRNRRRDQLANQEKFSGTKISEGKKSLVLQIAISKGKATKHIYLSFFDNSGEAFKDSVLLAKMFPNIYKADGLILLYEPTQVSCLRSHASRNNAYVSENSRMTLREVVFSVLEVLKHTHKDSIKKKREQMDYSKEPVWKMATFRLRDIVLKRNDFRINIPIALTMSKADQVKSLFTNTPPRDDMGFEVFSRSNGKLDLSFVNDLSDEIEDLVFNEKNGELAIQNYLRNTVTEYKNFAVVSCKVDPNTGQELGLAPHGVLFPLLWLFKKLDLVN